MRQLNIISADSHAEEPYELFERLPPKYRERAPRVEQHEDGVYVIQEGQRPIRQDFAAANLTEEDKRKEFRAEESRASGYGRESGTDVSQRRLDLDEDGVSAEVIYPQAIFKILASPDPDYQLVFARLYNDWYAEVFGGHGDRFVSPQRFRCSTSRAQSRKPNGLRSSAFDPSRFRSASRACPTTALTTSRSGARWRIWRSRLPSTCSLAARTRFSRTRDRSHSYGADMIMISLGIAEGMNPLTMLTASGVLQRHPKLKFVLVECGIGWLAWYLGVLDEIYEKRHMWHHPKLDLKPSEYFKRQGYATFGDDAIGLRNRDVTGVDCLMWGSDYPHDEGTFPHSREVIARTFGDLPEAETRKIVGENAAKLYGFSMG